MWGTDFNPAQVVEELEREMLDEAEEEAEREAEEFERWMREQQQG